MLRRYLACCLLLAGCNAAFGIDGLSFEGAAASSSSSASSSNSSASSSSSSSSSSSASVGGAGGMGGAGGAGGAGGTGGDPGPVCGNGVIEMGEECDDANDTTGDGCDTCTVTCDGPGETLLANLHCYRHVQSTLNWDQAQAACETWGGDLMAVTSAAEDAYLAANIVQRSWIGGTDVAVEGVFVWSNGEPWGYEKWRLGEPNNMSLPTNGFPEHCIEVYATDTEWNDARCILLKPYFCERHPPSAN